MRKELPEYLGQNVSGREHSAVQNLVDASGLQEQQGESKKQSETSRSAEQISRPESWVASGVSTINGWILWQV